MSGRSCSPRPRPWQKLRPKASISLAKPISFASGKARAILSLVIPGLSSLMARSIHSSASLYAVRCGEVARPTLNVRSEDHTSEYQSHQDFVCRLLLEL